MEAQVGDHPGVGFPNRLGRAAPGSERESRAPRRDNLVHRIRRSSLGGRRSSGPPVGLTSGAASTSSLAAAPRPRRGGLRGITRGTTAPPLGGTASPHAPEESAASVELRTTSISCSFRPRRGPFSIRLSVYRHNAADPDAASLNGEAGYRRVLLSIH